MGADEDVQPAKKTHSGGAWRAFIHSSVAGSGVKFEAGQMRALAEEYRNLSPEEKYQFAEMADVLP